MTQKMTQTNQTATRGLLEVDGVSTGYGDLPVVHEVSLRVDRGEIVALIGANGAGKTTLLSALTGLLPCWQGRVRFAGAEITDLPAHAVPSTGLVLVPEGRLLFGYLSVEDNLLLGGYRAGRAERNRRLRRVWEIFPVLAERRTQTAASMSGGEQQMCALARALMAEPSLLVLDEPSLGLAPIVVEQVLELIQQLCRDEGLTVLLVEQNIVDALEMADRGYVLDRGRVVLDGAASALLADEQTQRAYLGAQQVGTGEG